MAGGAERAEKEYVVEHSVIARSETGSRRGRGPQGRTSPQSKGRQHSIHADLTRRRLLTGGLAVTALVAAGCGQEESTQAQEPTTHTVEDFLGKTTIPKRPERIVADSVSVYAALHALGVEPVGAALPEGISTEYFAPADDDIANVVADDGWTIGLERALALDPDLIVAVGADYNRDNCKRYRDAVATYCFVEGWESPEEIKERFLALGRAIGREDEAREAIDAYDAKVADAKEQLAPHLDEIGKVGIVRFGAPDFIGVRSDDIVQTVFASLGLDEPTWPKQGPSGYVELSMETLSVLDRVDTLFVTLDDDIDRDTFEVFDSPLWQSLEVVSEGRAHVVSAWNGADLPQLDRIVDDITGAVLP